MWVLSLIFYIYIYICVNKALRKVLAKALALESCSEFIVRIKAALSRRGGLTEGHINAPRQCPALRHAAQTREALLRRAL